MTLDSPSSGQEVQGRPWLWRAYLPGAVSCQGLHVITQLLCLFHQLLTEGLQILVALLFSLQLGLQRFNLQSQRPSPCKTQFHKANLC